MKNHLKRISLFCGVALIMLAAFPVFSQDEVKINKKPLRDFGQVFINRVQTGELILTENFLVELGGELTKDGKFDLQKTRYTRSEGSEKMIDAAKSAIEAVNDSGIFKYLSQTGSNKLNLVLSQNDDQIYGILKFDSVSPAQAKSLVTVLNALIYMEKQKSENEVDKTLFNGTTVSESDKTVTIKTAIEKSVGQAIIQREIDKELARRQKTETNK